MTALEAGTSAGADRGTGTGALLRHRDFAVYALTSFVSNCGTFMQSIGVPFVLHDITGSNTWVGVSVFANWFASLLVGPMAGAICDRRSRRVVLVWSNIVQLLAALGLWLLAINGALHPWPIVGLLAVGGLAAGFQYSASQSLVPVLVPPSLAIPAVRLNSVGFTAARAIGPAVAGMTLATWGIKTTFLLNAISFLVFLVGLAVINPRPQPRPAHEAGWRREFTDGLRYVWSRPSMRHAVITAFVVGLFGSSVVQLSAGLAAEVYHVGARGLGWLTTCFGLGSVVASMVIVAYGNRVGRSRFALSGVVTYALGVTAALSVAHYPAVLPAYLLLGLGHVMTGISCNTTVQAQTDEAYRGRAITLFLMAMLSGTPIGALIGGTLADQIGLRAALGLYAAAMFAYAAYAVVRLRSLAGLDLDHAGAEELAASGRTVPEPVR